MQNIPPIPQSLLLEITPRCNYHCPWCYCVWHETGENLRCLPLRVWKEIVQVAIHASVRELTFTGGEATLRHDWRDLLGFARECSQNTQLSIFTNGSRLTDDDVLFCKKHRIYLSVSLQGLRTYGEMTGTRRTYRNTIKVVARANELHWPCNVSITVNHINLAELPDICGAAFLAGASIVQVNAMMLEGKARQRTDLALLPQEWQEAKGLIQKRFSSSAPIFFSDETLCHCRFQPEQLSPWDLTGPSACLAGKAFGVIDPLGRYRHCLHTIEPLCTWKELLSNSGENNENK